MSIYNDTPKTSVAVIKFSDPELAKKIGPELSAQFKRGAWETKKDNPNISKVGKDIAEKIKKLSLK